MRRLENTYDEVLFAAVQAGLEPDAEDLAQLQAPVGDDPDAFRREVIYTTRRIAEKQQQGFHGEARRLAEMAQDRYRAAFTMPTSAEPSAGGETSRVTEIAHLGARMFRS